MWKIKGVGGLRKKGASPLTSLTNHTDFIPNSPTGDGPGWMCSAFTDSIRGFGLPMTTAELDSLNAIRRESYGPDSPYVLKYGKDAVVLKHSPGFRFLDYGKETTSKGKKSGKEGSWNNEKFCQQTVDLLDAMDFLPEYNACQLVLQVDWSSGHSAGSGDGLSCSNMNGNYGGISARDMRDSLLTEEMIGPYDAKFNGADGTAYDVKLKAGDTQHMQHGVTVAGAEPPPPPFYKVDAPRKDMPKLDAAGAPVLDKKTGKPAIIQGFEGKPKGSKTILFETGGPLAICTDAVRNRICPNTSAAVRGVCIKLSFISHRPPQK